MADDKKKEFDFSEFEEETPTSKKSFDFSEFETPESKEVTPTSPKVVGSTESKLPSEDSTSELEAGVSEPFATTGEQLVRSTGAEPVEGDLQFDFQKPETTPTTTTVGAVGGISLPSVDDIEALVTEEGQTTEDRISKKLDLVNSLKVEDKFNSAETIVKSLSPEARNIQRDIEGISRDRGVLVDTFSKNNIRLENIKRIAGNVLEGGELSEVVGDERQQELVNEFNSLVTENEQIKSQLENVDSVLSQKEQSMRFIKDAPSSLFLAKNNRLLQENDALDLFSKSVWNNSIPLLIKGTGSLVEATGDIVSDADDKATDQVADFARKIGESFESEIPTMLSKKGEVINPVDEIFKGNFTKENVALVSGGALGTFLPMLATGGIAGLATGGSRTAVQITSFLSGMAINTEEVYEEAKQSGLSDREAAVMTLPVVTVMALMDSYLPTKLVAKKVASKDIAKNMVKEFIKDTPEGGLTLSKAFDITSKSMPSIVKEFAKESAKGGGQEFITETAQNLSKEVGQTAFNLLTGEDKFEQGTVKETIFDALKEGTIGAAVGTTAAGLSSINLQDASAYQKALELKDNPEAQQNFEEQLDLEVNAGKITFERANQIKEDVALMQDIENLIPEEDKQNKPRAILIASKLKERKKLEKKIDGKEEALVRKDKARIDKINQQIENIANDEQPVQEVVIESEEGAKEGIKVDGGFTTLDEIKTRIDAGENLIEKFQNGVFDLEVSNPSEETISFLKENNLTEQETVVEPEKPEVETKEPVEPVSKEPKEVEEPVKPKEEIDLEKSETHKKIKSTVDKISDKDLPTETKQKIQEQASEMTAPTLLFKGIDGKTDAKDHRINAHEGAEGVFMSEDIDTAKEFDKGSGIKKFLIDGTTETIRIDTEGKTPEQFRQEEIAAINESDADIIFLETIDGKITKDQKDRETQVVVKNQDALVEIEETPPPIPPKETKEPSEEKEKKQSGFQKRTLETAESTPGKEQVKTVVEENKVFYDVLNIAGTVDKVGEKIAKEGGFDKAYDRIISDKPTVDELPVAQVERQLALDFYGKELDAAIKEDRKADSNKAYNRVKALQEKISQDATKAGQSSSVLQMWKALRPDGTLDFMNRKIKEHNEGVRNKKVSGTEETVGSKIDNFKSFMDSLTDEQISEILDSDKGKKIVNKILGKNKSKVKDELKERIRKRKEKVDSVVNRLDNLKISPDKLFALPPGINLIPSTWNASISIIQKSLQAGESMATAIDKAVVFIKEKLTDEETFDEKSFRSQFEEEKKSVDTDDLGLDIDKALEELGVSINSIIKEHYTKKDELGRNLVEKLVEGTGLSKSDAEILSKEIKKEFDNKVRKRAEEELAKTIGKETIPTERKRKKLIDDLVEKINLGAVDSDFYNEIFSDHLGLAKPLSTEQAAEIKRLSDVFQKQESGSFFEQKAASELLTYLDGLFPRDDRVNTFFSLYYSSLLSGMSTHVLNIGSAGSNLILKPIRDIVNFSKWAKAARKANTFKDFLAYAPFNDMLYMPMAFSHGTSLGTKEFADVWKNGDVDSKFVEQVNSNKFSRLNPLERRKYGNNAFKPITVKVAGKKVDINPFNYYKFVGRLLSAEDRLMFRNSYDMEMFSIIRERMLDKGLRGKELKKAVIEEFTQSNTDMDAVLKSLDEEIANFEKDTRKKITKEEKAIRLRQILEKNLPVEERLEAENLARGNIFTDDRGGLIANMANTIGRFANSNQALAILLKPFVPFTRIVGNVSEYMMDTIPIYGHMRANGLSLTGLVHRTNVDIKTSQLGEKGSKAYYEQMGRAWLGTVGFAILGSILIGTDEDDDIYITGGYSPDKFKRGRENVTPKYTIVINGAEIPYLNIPGLAIPLSMIGNYNDRLNLGDPEEELSDRLLASSFNSVGTIKDMSFLKGVQDLLKMGADIASGEEGPTKRVGRELYKKYFLTATKPLPQNFNLVDQIEKIYDPTSFSQRSIQDITMYGLGVQRFVNKPSLDVFGEEIKTLPGETLLPYAHWLGLKGEDRRWKYLSKYNYIPSKISGNREIYVMDKKGNVERRRPEEDELFKYTKKAGKIFNENLLDYMSFTNAEERAKDSFTIRGKKISGVQKDLDRIWNNSKKQARNELFN